MSELCCTAFHSLVPPPPRPEPPPCLHRLCLLRCRVAALPPRQRVVAIAAANKHSAAVTAAGEVWTWGSNASAQLGYGTSDSGCNPIPRPVEALKGRRLVNVAAAKHHTGESALVGAHRGESKAGGLKAFDSGMMMQSLLLSAVKMMPRTLVWCAVLCACSRADRGCRGLAVWAQGCDTAQGAADGQQGHAAGCPNCSRRCCRSCSWQRQQQQWQRTSRSQQRRQQQQHGAGRRRLHCRHCCCCGGC